MPVDKLLINQRLSYIKEYLEELVKLSELPKDKFLKKINSAAAESFLRRSLEAIFDVGRHILAKNDGTKFALEYKSIAKGLQEKGIINKDLENKLIQKGQGDKGTRGQVQRPSSNWDAVPVPLSLFFVSYFPPL
jgi:uncharacterized protein YutE (UPF0331/DUF86 family)